MFLRKTTLALGPSNAALRQAAQLGMEMARRERGSAPDLSGAGHYDRYVRYRNAQRERMEAREAFADRWLERLMQLAAKEGKASGLRMNDSMSSWDNWYNAFVQPLKDAFWYAWEHTWDLPARYAAARRTVVEAGEKPVVLRVADAIINADSALQQEPAEPESTAASAAVLPN